VDATVWDVAPDPELSQKAEAEAFIATRNEEEEASRLAVVQARIALFITF
jgi:hypothetical protein